MKAIKLARIADQNLLNDCALGCPAGQHVKHVGIIGFNALCGMRPVASPHEAFRCGGNPVTRDSSDTPSTPTTITDSTRVVSVTRSQSEPRQMRAIARGTARKKRETAMRMRVIEVLPATTPGLPCSPRREP